MRSSLASGKSATPPARCIHRPQRDTSSAEYRLLVSRASVGASRELSSRRSPALAPHTHAVSPTFRYGAFSFVASAHADLSSARLASCVHNRAYTNWESTTLAYEAMPNASTCQRTPHTILLIYKGENQNSCFLQLEHSTLGQMTCYILHYKTNIHLATP